jgi:hypothetical protein
MHFLLITVCALLATGVPAAATTVLARWTPDVVTIGADSMLRYMGPRGYDYEGFCKINVWHNVVVWAIAGAYGMQSSFISSPFIPEDTINQELSRDSNISGALTTIENAFLARLGEILGEMKRQLPRDAFAKEKNISHSKVFSLTLTTGIRKSKG